VTRASRPSVAQGRQIEYQQPIMTARSKPIADQPPASDALTPELVALAEGRHGDPFTLLGRHESADGALFRTLQTGARRVFVIDAATGESAGELARIHPAGLFAATLAPAPMRYRLRLEVDGQKAEIEDPYRFGPLLGELDLYLLGEGSDLRLYDKLGAHPRTIDGVAGTAFAVWAPNARRASVVGAWNGWDGRSHPMRCSSPGSAPASFTNTSCSGPTARCCR
jgi:1,4-alpha-glucan branching enzyme